MAEQTKPVGVLVKTIQVLRELARSESPLGPTELAQLTGLDRSAVHRILITLARDRLVERSATYGTYHLGIGLAAIGLIAANRLDLRRIARPHLEALFARFSETVNLAVLDSDAILYIDILEPQRGLRMTGAIGARDPAATTALGKAILAFLPEDRRNALVAKLPLPPRTPHSLRSRNELLRTLDRVREEGIARDDEEQELGACCVSAPIFGLASEVAGAVSVSVPTVRFDDERRAAITAGVVETAQRISRELSD
jgi:DNA-binding IclR family transcriptional regulator